MEYTSFSSASLYPLCILNKATLWATKNSDKTNDSNRTQFKPFGALLVEFPGHGTTAFKQEFSKLASKMNQESNDHTESRDFVTL